MEGLFNGDFCVTGLGGLYLEGLVHGGAYFRNFTVLLHVSDHVLVGHVVSTSTVADEFECHQKCLRNSSCKSFNVHPGADIAKRLCELNNKKRKMKPDDFIKKKGSSYYGQVKVRSTV